MKRTALVFVLFVSGCVAPVDMPSTNTCVVRGVYIEGDAGIMGVARSEYEGTQVSIANMKACPGADIKFPAPRDSSKTIDIKIPGD